MNNKELVEKIISLFEKGKLSSKEISCLEKYPSNDINLVISCVKNDIDAVKEILKQNQDISICNGKLLRFTVMQGYVELSILLLKNNIEP